jgi:hypothetical protein
MKLSLFAILLAFAPAPTAEAFEDEALVETVRASKAPVRTAPRLESPRREAPPALRSLRRSDDAPTIASPLEVVPREGCRPPPGR